VPEASACASTSNGKGEGCECLIGLDDAAYVSYICYAVLVLCRLSVDRTCALYKGDDTKSAAILQAATAPANNGAQKPAITQAWKEVLELQKNGTTWTGKITAVNKGGVVVDVNGLRGFIPMSRLDPGRLPKTDFALEDIEGLVGQPVSAKVIQVCSISTHRMPLVRSELTSCPAQLSIYAAYMQEYCGLWAPLKLPVSLQVNIPSRQLVLSEQATMVEQLAASLQTGDVVEGIVTRTTDYGAFVSLRSPDGNLHGAVVRPT
jgi:ribosomal protein S1